MIFRGTRPKDAILLLDLLPRDAVVVGVTTARRDAHFVEDSQRAIKLKVILPPHASREFLNDPPVGPSFTRRVRGFVDFQDATLTVCGDTLIFAPGAAGEDD